MLKIAYTFDSKETAIATLDFLEGRPLLRLFIFGMNALCLAIFLAYIVKYFKDGMNFQDTLMASFTIFWLFGRRVLNESLLKWLLSKKLTENQGIEVSLDDKKMVWDSPTMIKGKQYWKHTKKVLKSKAGYIIPLTGMDNAAKFIWLPNRAFKTLEEENTLLNYLKAHDLMIKKI